MEMTFTIESAGDRASRVQMGRHEVIFDMPERAGGTGRGPGPLAMFAASAAACMHYFASGVLARHDLPTEGLTVTVHAHQSEDDGPNRLDRIRLEVGVPEGVPEELLPAIEERVKSCPVHGTLSHLPDVEVALSRA